MALDRLPGYGDGKDVAPRAPVVGARWARGGSE